MKYGILPDLEKKLRRRREALGQARGRALASRDGERGRNSRYRIALDRNSGNRLVEGEREKLLRLDEVLHKRVIGQDEAVQLVANAVIRARSGIKDPRQPDRLFHLSRPDRRWKDRAWENPGGGALRYRRKPGAHRYERVPGTPHGFTPYRGASGLRRLRRGRAAERGRCAEALFGYPVRRNRESRTRDVFNTLLQILDDGRLTDSQGRTVDFKNTVIIMTSNIGSEYLLQGVTREGEIREDARTTVMDALKAPFHAGVS